MLTEKQQKEIRRLQEICEKEDGIELKLNWDLLEARSEHENVQSLVAILLLSMMASE